MAEDKKNVAPAKVEHTAVKKVDSNEKLTLGARGKKWLREMRSELKKVVWPTRQQVINNTGVALLVMAVSAVVIWGFDQIAQNLVQALITVVKG
jgi:preprotein translocase subunit SecE